MSCLNDFIKSGTKPKQNELSKTKKMGKFHCFCCELVKCYAFWSSGVWICGNNSSWWVWEGEDPSSMSRVSSLFLFHFADFLI